MRYGFLLLILFFLFQFGFAQIEKPTEWSSSVSKQEVKVGETVDLIFTAKIKDGWYLYSSDFDENLGPMVTTLEIEPHPTFQSVGKLKPVGAKKKYDDMWGGEYTYFVGTAKFIQTVKILKENPVIRINLIGQACTDVSGKCVPVDHEFVFNSIKVVASDVQPKNSNQSDKPKEPKTTVQPSTGKMSISELEQEKERNTKRRSDGQDESVLYLKEFVRKWGRK
ncbi:MAG: protein-disulfide reductase DsbD domain-containing protein [Cytophagaceae bacterium]